MHPDALASDVESFKIRHQSLNLQMSSTASRRKIRRFGVVDTNSFSRSLLLRGRIGVKLL